MGWQKKKCVSRTHHASWWEIADLRIRGAKKDWSEKRQNLVSHSQSVSHLSRKFLALNFFTDIAYLYPARCNCL